MIDIIPKIIILLFVILLILVIIAFSTTLIGLFKDTFGKKTNKDYDLKINAIIQEIIEIKGNVGKIMDILNVDIKDKSLEDINLQRPQGEKFVLDPEIKKYKWLRREEKMK